jgi:tetratricopeptide (TPR) repeat protein
MLTDLFNLIPQQLKQQLLDTVVDTVAGQADAVGGHSLAAKIRQLRSDASFTRAYDAGLQRAVGRFIQEYEVEDEDLVTAVAQSPALFANKQVQASLLAMVSNPGKELAEEQKALVLRFDTVLPERKNRDRVDKAMTYLLRCLVEETWHLPELQPIYTLQFARMTAEATREQVALQKSQLAAVSTLGEDIREGLLQLTDIISRQKQANSEDTDSLQPLPAVLHNLPQRDYGEFVGREEALSKVMSLLQPQSRHFLIVIDGVGGIGKSTLALEVAHRCLQFSQQTAVAEEESSDLSRLRQTLVDRFNEEELRTLCFDMALDYDMLPGNGKGGKSRELVAYLDRRNRLAELIESIQRARPDIVWGEEPELAGQPGEQAEKFEAIIWVSAKNDVLTADGIVPRRQVVSTLDDIYTTISIALGREEITRTEAARQHEVVRRILTRQKTLLIVDNLETVEDQAVIDFLRELPAPTKAIVTTRHRIDVAYAIRLTGMPWAEAARIIQNESAAKGIQLDEVDAQKLFERTGGIPIALVWCIAQMGNGYSIQSVLTRLGQPHSNIAKFIFENALNAIVDTSAQTILYAIAQFRSGTTREALGYIAELPELDLDDGLAQLQKLSLVNQLNGRFDILPLTRHFLTNQALVTNETRRLVQERWLTYLLTLTEENQYFNRQSYANLSPEIENIKGAVKWCWENRQRMLIDFVNNIAYFLHGSGYWTHLEKYFKWGIETAVFFEEEVPQARFYYLLGNINQYWGKLEIAETYIQRAISISEATGQTHRLALSLNRLGLIERRKKQYMVAESLFQESIVLASKLDSDDLMIRNHLCLSIIAIDQGDYAKATAFSG